MLPDRPWVIVLLGCIVLACIATVWAVAGEAVESWLAGGKKEPAPGEPYDFLAERERRKR